MTGRESKCQRKRKGHDVKSSFLLRLKVSSVFAKVSQLGRKLNLLGLKFDSRPN